jgi:trehalose/maltose hydrolase-like predicted phosphorylase
MLLYLRPDKFDEATVRANWNYYTPRTDLPHDSSLTPGIQAILACRLGDLELAYPFYRQAALVNLKDLRLNTEHGIHGATAGSVWQAAVFSFGGLRLTDKGPTELKLRYHLTSHIPLPQRDLQAVSWLFSALPLISDFARNRH